MNFLKSSLKMDRNWKSMLIVRRDSGENFHEFSYLTDKLQ